jgi:Dna[CI] antecedent, DciA
MGRANDQPQHLADVLRTVAKRVKKVDLTLIEEIRQYWPTIVDVTLATTCQPEFVKNGVLIISVPSGAFAQQIIIEQDVILGGLAVLGERAPTAVKTMQKA